MRMRKSDGKEKNVLAKRKNKTVNRVFTYLLIAVIGLALLYPIIWMFFASFKTNEEIYGSTRLLPAGFSFHNFVDGWKGNGVYTYARYFFNTFKLVIPVTLLTLVSSTLAAYAFERFRFRGKNILFAVMIALLMLPNSVLMIPRYSMYSGWGWINTYLPFYVPAALASNSFFIYMLVQFLHGIPGELDESACIDGCGIYAMFFRIILPIVRPGIATASIFAFLNTWNELLFANTFVDKQELKTLPVGIMSFVGEHSTNWGVIGAGMVVATLPTVVIYFLLSKHVQESLTIGAVKG